MNIVVEHENGVIVIYRDDGTILAIFSSREQMEKFLKATF